jgi:hypothetical protein
MAKTKLSAEKIPIQFLQPVQKNELRVAYKSDRQQEDAELNFENFPISNSCLKLVQLNSFFLLRLVK